MSDYQALLIRGTAVVAFFLFAGSLAGQYRWTKYPRPDSAAILYALACGVFLLHVGLAFHWAHHWSHAAAYEATARRTVEVVGLHWGGGLWVNYLFVLWWPFDAARRLVASYQRSRPSWATGSPTTTAPRIPGRWVGRITDAVALFLWFQATVVFGHGWVRWVAVSVFSSMAIMAARAGRANRLPPRPAGGDSKT